MFGIWVAVSIVISILALGMFVFTLCDCLSYGDSIDQEDAILLLGLLGIVVFSFLWPLVLALAVPAFVVYLFLLAFGVIGDR